MDLICLNNFSRITEMSLNYISKISKIFIWIIILSSASVKSANNSGVGYEAYMKNLSTYEIDPYSSGLMGDVIDKKTGAIEFEYIDIDIPGNSDLEVQLRRKVKTVFSGSPLYDELTYHLLNGDTSSFVFKYGIVTFDTPRITYQLPNSENSIPLSIRNRNFCSGKTAYGASFAMDGSMHNFNNGYTLIVPGKVNEKILVNDGLLPGSYSLYSTKSGWKINCTDNEGFEAISPTGIKYTFDFIDYATPTQQFITDYEASGIFRDLNIYVTKVEDRFGNWVNYVYSDRKKESIEVLSLGERIPFFYKKADLEEIKSNDGRVIKITRTPDGANVNANGKLWEYKNHGALVVRPDGKFWEFSWFDSEDSKIPIDITTGVGGIKRYVTPGTDNGKKNGNKYACKQYDYSSYLEVKHPDGATGKFLIGESLQGDTEVDSGYAFEGNWESFPRCYSYPSLIKKSIQYSKNEEYTWIYEYSNNWGSYDEDFLEIYGYFSSEYATFDKKLELPNIQLPNDIYIPAGLNKLDYKTIKSIQPDGSYIVEYIDRKYSSVTYGKIIVSRFFDENGVLLKEINNTYSRGANLGRALPGVSWSFNKVVSFENNMDITSVRQSIFHSDGEEVYTKKYSEMNEYGKYLKLHEFNNYNGKERYYKYTYLSDTINWVLNKPSLIEISPDGIDYTEVERMSFHNSSGAYKGLPNCHYMYGLQVSCNLSYWTENNYSGKARKVYSDSNTNRWIEYSDYKRGIPQNIKKPNQTGSNPAIAYIVVDNNGWIKNHTDFEGHCTKYDYDVMGRKTLISSCDNLWQDVNISYTTTSDSEGLQYVEAGMFKQFVSQGRYHKAIYFDSMFRPKLVKELDSSDAETSRYMRNEFDYDNRLIFQGKPHTSSSTPYGIYTSYDILGRILSINDNTIQGQINNIYLTNNRVSKTDAKGNVTSITYLSYGSPTQAKPIFIDSPEGVKTTLSYNIHDNVESIKQNSLTEYRVYDSYQRLCKTIRADVGNVAYNYNALGEIQWMASGSSVSDSEKSCDSSTVENFEKTKYLYDNLGNIKTINYGDNSPSKNFTYDNNGNLKAISAGNVSHLYTYNSANLLTSETLSVDSKTFNLSYSYDRLRHLSSVTYPNGESVYFSPNAFGQPTRAGEYATQVKYHPNGAIESFTYGNGFLHRTSLNSDGSGRPEYISEYNGTTVAFDHTIGFDRNNNMEFLRDNFNSAYNLDLTYDGLDRLGRIVNSFNGSGFLDYDDIGNIKYYKLGDQVIDYFYDNNLRLNHTSGSYKSKFSYDERGNVTKNGRNQSMVYNLAQQVISSSSNGINLKFTYDGNDKRTVKDNNGKKEFSIYGKNGQLLHYVKSDGTAVNNIYLNKRIIAKVEGWAPTLTPAYIDVVFDKNIDLELGCPVDSSFRNYEYCIDFTKEQPIDNYQPKWFDAFQKAVRITWTYNNIRSCAVIVETFTGSSPYNKKLLMEVRDVDGTDGIYLPVNSSLNYSLDVICTPKSGAADIIKRFFIKNGQESIGY